MNKTTKNASASVKKAQEKKTVAKKQEQKTPALEFATVLDNELKVTDKAFKSVVIGALAQNDKFELPLAVTQDGAQAYSLDNVRRAFYSLYTFFKGKLKISLVKKEGQEGFYYTVLIERAKSKQTYKFIGAKQSDKKLKASSKRAKDAQERKAQKAQETADKAQEEIKNAMQKADKLQEEKKQAREEQEKAIKSNDTKSALQFAKKAQVASDNEFVARASAIIRKALPDVSAGECEKIARDICAIRKN